jgi:hypothetical protein
MAITWQISSHAAWAKTTNWILSFRIQNSISRSGPIVVMVEANKLAREILECILGPRNHSPFTVPLILPLVRPNVFTANGER